MSNLPYLNLENDLCLNSGIIILLIKELSKSSKGNSILSLDKLQILYFLITRPSFLNKVLLLDGKPTFEMHESEYFNVSAQSINVDELFDKNKLRLIIQFLAAKKLLEFSYTDKDGFVVELSEKGSLVATSLSDDYFSRIQKYIDSTRKLRSLSVSKLDSLINTVLKKGV